MLVQPISVCEVLAPVVHAGAGGHAAGGLLGERCSSRKVVSSNLHATHPEA